MGRRKKAIPVDQTGLAPEPIVIIPDGVVKYTLGVQLRTDPREVTYACKAGADWTRKLEAVRWWPSEKEARDACIAAMERTKKQFWHESAEWVVEIEEVVKERLSALSELIG